MKRKKSKEPLLRLGLPLFFLLGLTLLAIGSEKKDSGKPVPLQVDGWAMREEYKEDIGKKFAKGDFAALEKEADHLRTGVLWPGGTWKLSEFYDGLVSNKDSNTPDKFPALIEQWKSQFPSSQTPVVALGNWWTKQAWKARGGGWAYKVSDSSWKPFKECLVEARKVLETIRREDVRCPEWYSVMMKVALGQGWDREEEDKLVADATALAPTYFSFYSDYAYYLLPRWYGETGEWESFARRIANERHDKGLYAHLVWTTNNNGEDLAPVDWPLFVEGGDELMKQWPASGWTIANLCKVAYRQEDFATLHRWASRLQGLAIPDASLSPGVLRYAMLRAEHPDYRPPDPISTTKTGHSDCWAVIFLPSGQVAYGTDDGVVRTLDPDKPAPQKTPLPALLELFIGPSQDPSVLVDFHDPNKPVSKFALSPDGKLLAIGQGTLVQKTPGFVVVYNLEKKSEVARIEGWKGTAEFPAFSPDGKFLYAAGGLDREVAQIKRWNRETGAVEDLDWVKEAKNPLFNIAISPDGKTAAADWFQNIRVWDTASGRLLHDGPPIKGTAECVWCVRFSPDGKTIVAASSPIYVDRGESNGGLLWWDAQTFQQLPAHPDDHVSGADRMIFSPDGSRIYNNDQNGMLFVRDAHTGKLLNLFPSNQEYVLDIAISPDGKRLATAGRDGTVKIWDTAQIDGPMPK